MSAVSARAQVAFGNAQLFNDDWLFLLADDSLAARAEYDDTKWRRLSLPHDWSVEHHPSPSLASCTGYLPGGIGWYRKHFTVTDANEHHYIYFEGVYNRSEVYLNGHLLGRRPNGYISFLYDMTSYLRDGDNVLSVRVDHSRQADSRWYTGSGIYRDVYIVSAGDTHFRQWGIGWEATSITTSEAKVKVSAEVEHLAEMKSTVTVRATLLDANDKIVAHTSQRLTLQPGSNDVQMMLTVKNPKLWDLDNPYLYKLTTEIIGKKNTALDCSQCTVGLRTLRFDADKGFFLNGQNTKVKGVCLHHDAGVLGAAVPEDVWERRLKNLKAIGVNAIRMSHNPQAPCVYDLCDRLGLLVMDEASDEWEFPKRKWVEGWNVGTPSYDGTYDFFEEWIERDVTDMVRRDRCHASVFLWSIGNEVDYPNDPYSHPVLDSISINQPMFGGYNPDAPDAMRIGRIAKRLVACVKAVDTSRPTTGALAGVVMSNETEYPEAVDVVGYNYTEDRFAIDHKTYPKRILYASETGRGIDKWRTIEDNDYLFGQFIWTGTHYLGESGRWPSRGLGTGLLDFASLTNPSGYMRAALWKSEPTVYAGTYPQREWIIQDAPDIWNYEDGQLIRVVCYTNQPLARLRLNGEIVGELREKDAATGIAYWDIPFASGTLTAEGCTADGQPVVSYELKTSGRPYALRATVDKTEISGRQVAHILVEVVDEQGIVVKLADNDIRYTVEGNGARVIGIENGNNNDMSDPQARHRRAHMGRVLTYVQATETPEPTTISFFSPLLKSTSITLNSSTE